MPNCLWASRTHLEGHQSTVHRAMLDTERRVNPAGEVSRIYRSVQVRRATEAQQSRQRAAEKFGQSDVYKTKSPPASRLHQGVAGATYVALVHRLHTPKRLRTVEHVSHQNQFVVINWEVLENVSEAVLITASEAVHNPCFSPWTSSPS